MTQEHTLREKINEILIELTDKVGYDDSNPNHLESFRNAEEGICNLIASHTQALREKIEGMKIEITCDLPNIVKMCDKCEEGIIKNQALDAVLALLSEETK